MSTLKVNTIDSHSGSLLTIDSTADVLVASATTATSSTTGALKVTGGISTQENLYVGGNAVITGTMTANGGTITLGDAGTDNVTIGGEINSDIIPDATNTYDLGSSSKKWAEIHATDFTGDLAGNVVGNVTGNVTGNTSGSAGSSTGNSATATILATGRTVAMTGDGTWNSGSFNGSANVTAAMTLANSGVSAATYGSATAIPQIAVDAKGRITSATTVAVSSDMAMSGDSGSGTITVGTDTFAIAGGTGIATAVSGDTLTINATSDPTITLGGDLSGSVTLTNLGNGTLTATVADDSHNHTVANVDGLQAALDLKATLASPTLTGAPLAPTAAANTNTTQIATTAYVQTEITDLIDGAPGTLDTLNELAAAINDDASYSSTLTTALATKTAKTSNQSLGSAANAMTISGNTITLARGDSTTDTVTVPDTNTTYSVGDGGLTQINFTSADNTKLDGIASSATNVTNNNQLTNGAGYITSYTNTTYSAGSGLDLSGTTFSVESDLRDGITHIGRDSQDFIEIATTYFNFQLDGGERVRIENDGDLHADGDVIAYSSTISDERLKTGIMPITGALAKVNQLNGCTFTYLSDGKKSAGLIAQDVEKVLPSAVSEKKLPLKIDDGEKYKVLQYDQTIGLLVEAIKELSNKVDNLEKK